MFTAIVNSVAPAGSNLDDAISRRAACDVFEHLFEQKVAIEDGAETMNTMTADDVRNATEEFVCLYVYYRWIEELGKSIERGSVSPQDATKLEREVKQFVRDIVHLKTGDVDLLTLKWQENSGRRFVDDVFHQAYSLLEDVE